MGNQQPTECDLAWLACAVDSEGSINMGLTIRKGRSLYNPAVQVCNTDPAYIVKVITVLEQLGVTFHMRCYDPAESGKLGKKDVWYVLIHRLTCLETLLTQLLPYFVSKTAKAKLLLRWIHLRIPKLNKPNELRVYTTEDTELAEQLRRFNDHATRDPDQGKIESELRGKLAELAEMASRLRK